MATANPILGPYLEQFGRLRAELPGDSLPWLAERREEAIARFVRDGFPTPRVEAWKYTNLRDVEKLAPVPAPQALSRASVDALPTVQADRAPAHRLVFVAGRFRADLSTAGDLPRGVELTNLASAIEIASQLVERGFGGPDAFGGSPLAALNTAFAEDGLVLRVGPGVAVEDPIEVVFVGTAGDAPVMFHPRSLVVLEPGASATLVEHHVGLGDGAYLANGVMDVRVGEGARLGHYKLQAEGPGAFHVGSTSVRLGKDAAYDGFVLSTGARLARNEVHAVLDGTGCEYRINGAYAVAGRQHTDMTTVIDHAQPHGSSHEMVQGVIDGAARAVFQGKIVVRPGAQKTDGYQLNRALLLSDQAEIDSKPELEIYADDVKCSHGATAGELDEAALFYLRARGISEAEARRLLVVAFLNEVIGQVRHETVRAALERHVAGWLAARSAEARTER